MPQSEKLAGITPKNISNALKALKNFKGSRVKPFKSDGVVVKNYDDLVKTIEKHVGKKGLGGKTSGQIAEDITLNKGGIITDILPKMLGKKVGASAEKHYTKFQKKLADIDIKTGNKIYEALKNDKGGVRDKLSKAFLYKHHIPVKESLKGKPEKLIGVNVPGATAPVEKARKAALPIVGSFAIGSKLADMTNEKKDGEGGGKRMEKTQGRRTNLIEKLSGMMGIDSSNSETSQSNCLQQDLPNIAGVASKMLKFAASEYRRLLDDNEKLASENKRLQREIENKTKLENATKLAELMNEKGLIKKADINSQTERIINLDDAGYVMLKSAIENVSANGFEKEGFDKLTFLDSDINMNVKDKKPTLADAIGESV